MPVVTVIFFIDKKSTSHWYWLVGLPLCEGLIKLNVDDATIGNMFVVARGGLLRTNEGMWLCGFVFNASLSFVLST